LRKLQKEAFELIMVLELEASGIRDGDGFWHGSDPPSGILRDIQELAEQLDAEREKIYRAGAGNSLA
jgi:hypothetical protein